MHRSNGCGVQETRNLHNISVITTFGVHEGGSGLHIGRQQFMKAAHLTKNTNKRVCPLCLCKLFLSVFGLFCMETRGQSVQTAPKLFVQTVFLLEFIFMVGFPVHAQCSHLVYGR